MKNEQKIEKNDQKVEKTDKNLSFNPKRIIFHTIIGVGVAIIMVYTFGKLAPVAIVSYRLVNQIIKPLFV